MIITTSGIFCLETKARTSKNGQYNVQADYDQIADQVAKHKESIKYVLEKSNNPVIINLLRRLPNIDQLIRNVVVFVSRTDDEFTLTDSNRYQKMEIDVVQLADIQSLLVKAKMELDYSQTKLQLSKKKWTIVNNCKKKKIIKKMFYFLKIRSQR